MNQNTVEKLQFNDLKELIQSYCVSPLGREKIKNLMPSSDLDVVNIRLNETSEARAILDAGGNIPFMGVSHIERILSKVDKGLILNPAEFMQVADFLKGSRRVKNFMLARASLAPVLSTYVYSMAELDGIENDIESAIKNNQVDSYASKELKRVRDQISQLDKTIKEELDKFLKNKQYKNVIQESIISVKDDRYTIPIKASYKNQVPGTIIEVSSVGSTVFIEPNRVGKYTDELAALKVEEEMIEYQILATLSGLVANELSAIQINIELTAQYDMIFAKAKYSKSVDGVAPKMNDHGYIRLVDCKHPLLSGEVVPLQFEIGQDFRSMIITGPNAGGKTIVLKTIGLASLAAMSGFHILADAETELAVFDRIFVDFGDNQSLENALSTFSSHMKNLSEVLQGTNNRTLLLFDEIGSGTEPNEGAAIAIALLEDFYLKGAITVATTHYSEIKEYSERHTDYMNAAMLFDPETLEPKFQLVIGESGASNALWISRKMNVPEAVLQRAEKYMIQKAYNLERVKESKRLKPREVVEISEETPHFGKGDRVKLLEHDDFGIVFEGADELNQVTVFFQNDYLEVPAKRLALEYTAAELYPAGYDLDTLFVDFQTRKLEHDIERGSKKALKKLHKEMRQKNK